MANILIIDDDKMICDMLSRMIMRMGHHATYALTLKEGLKEAASEAFDVVFLDVRLPDGNGLDALPRIRETTSPPEVIIITGEGDPDGAELAIKSGAWDYVEKPLLVEAMTLSLVRSLQYREEKKARKPPVALKREGIVGHSPQVKACLDLLAQAANSDASVFITGETGTGKELFARAIHDNSPRANKNFVVVDCAALPDTLVESMLFGHEKGAFTGADKAQEGLVKQADGGTLFLDEAGELPMPIQKAFLRVLQERRFRPIGGKREAESNFRVVAATNRNLDEMVQHGQFRRDLLFRLRTFAIELPPLRERREDIRELALHYIAKLNHRHGTGTKGVSPEFLDALTAYDWPGNVRELFNTLERVLASARHNPTLFPKHLPTHIRIQAVRDSIGKEARAQGSAKASADPSGMLPSLRDFRMAAATEAERQYLQHLVSLTSENVKEACRISKLSRSRFYELLKKHKISIPG
ncbi:MAG: sigma-54-dependent Fis family transcriptional regulator [Deltaproteobacteria bacterium]|nr:sigma-54-dependent Fis family transcriptional regulator [Deltaproteobacteria bacterium]MBW2074716.1 sigma-54-dependent Fis family transcriptional regulator [Deltaproteobacteria bacterium]